MYSVEGRGRIVRVEKFVLENKYWGLQIKKQGQGLVSVNVHCKDNWCCFATATASKSLQ